PPRPAGRGKALASSPVQRRAEAAGLEVRTPSSFREAAERQAFAALELDVAVVAAYGLILPEPILSAPYYGCLNVHASLLPRWRGAAPIQRAIMAGDTESGICIMQMEEGLDTGPVLARRTVRIDGATTAQTLHDALAAQGAELIVQTLAQIAAGNPPQTETQPEEGVTYAHMLTKEDGRIDWTRPAAEIERQLRALTPWPGVWCMQGEHRVKVLAAEIAEGKGKPGEILDRHLIVACGEGALKLTKIQPQDRKPMDGLSFMNGTHLNVGDTFQ
ncbi:MAG TPA: methionyl-tRNA formyltransferase, partial [Patescibacteria group bacterium]|nr:methionyl-tRNA formyltransferase [Patescibacteria group bacterium]